MRYPPLLLGALLACAACADGSTAPAAHAVPPADTLAVPYRLDRPDARVELPSELREISGLTWLPNGNLGAVQDEAGTLYEIDPASGQVLGRESFRNSGDFEGIERLDLAMWALRSDGDLYRVRRGGGDSVEVAVLKTGLNSGNDTEGLGYDPVRRRLLIACKESPGKGLGDVRAVYAFDPETETLSLAFTLDRRLLDASGASFKPSALAVHPGSGEVYLLSSVRKAIAVVRPNGSLRVVVPLPSRLLPQPEGLAFAPDGTLFISSEGPDGPATLVRFASLSD